MNCFPVLIVLLLCVPVLSLAGSSTTSGVSNAMNPALSVNALSVADYSTKYNDPSHNGLRLQEAEMHFTSVVDPFWKANVILSCYPVENGSSYEANVEEANISGTSLPAGVALKLGKFFVDFGKHSKLHTHQFAFVSAPAAVSTFLGAGFTESGIELAYSLPTSWYSDLVVYGVNGDTEVFDNGSSRIALGGHLKNVWDTSDNATFEMGFSALNAATSPDHFGQGGLMTTYGIDLQYKWVSGTSSHGPALALTAEGLLPTFEEDNGEPYGWYVMAQYRCHHNWWLGFEHGYIDCGHGAMDVADLSPFNGKNREYKVNATFTPSEFSALRLEAAYYDDLQNDTDNLQVSLQWNFTIGSHPAHLY